MREDIHIMFNGPEKYNTEDLCDIIDNIKPKYFILFYPWEGYECRLTEYLNWDYTVNPIHCDDILKFENKLIENNVIFYVVLGVDYNDETFSNYKTNPIQNFKILFWPTALLHYTYYGMVNFYGGVDNSIINYNNLNKIYLNLNNHPREHRSNLIDYLSKYDLLDYGINTWNADLNSYEYIYEHWNPKNLTFDDYDIKHLEKSYSNKLLNSNTLFNIVAESSYNDNNIFYTEKTWKPILIGQPFIILGNINQNLNLLKYNLSSYYKVVDYSFDKMDNIKYRILGIIDNLMKFKHMNLNKIRETITHEIDSNRKMALSIIFKDSYIPIELTNLYLNYGNYFLNLFKSFNENYNSGFQINQNFNLIEEIFKNKK